MINWPKTRLSCLCTRIGDGLHGTPEYSEKGNVYFINGNNLKDGKIVINSDTKKVSESDYKKNHIELNCYSLLIGINGSLGNMAFYSGETVMLGKSSAYLNFKTDINKFYYYYFQLQSIQKYFYDVATGSTIKNLSLKSLQDFEVPLPSEIEYKKIASVLSVLDDKIKLNNKINAELEAMAKTLYDYWFVQFDFPFMTSSGVEKPYKSSGGEMVYDEVLKREIPKGWEVGDLSNLGDVIGGSTPPREKEEYFTRSGVAWITPRDLSNNKGKKFIVKGELDVSEIGVKNASLRIMPKGTVLLSTRAPVGYLAISQDKVTTNQGFKSFVPSKGFSTEFIYYAVKNLIPTIENNAVGSTFKEISASTLKSIPICLPEVGVLNAYNKNITPFFDRQKILELQNQELASLRDWLLPMLMNGQVKVVEGYGEVEGDLGMVSEEEVKYGD